MGWGQGGFVKNALGDFWSVVIVLWMLPTSKDRWPPTTLHRNLVVLKWHKKYFWWSEKNSKWKRKFEVKHNSQLEILTQWQGYLGCNSSCSMDSNSFRLVTTFWTFLDNWSVCSSTIFINAASCSWYVEHNRFLFRSSIVSSCICLSFSSYKEKSKINYFNPTIQQYKYWSITHRKISAMAYDHTNNPKQGFFFLSLF